MTKAIRKKCEGFVCAVAVLRAILILLVAVLIAFLYMAYIPVKVYEIEAPYDVLKDTYQRGQNVEVVQKYCKLKDLPSKVSISLVDGYTEHLRTIDVNTPVGCYDRVSTSVTIPEYVSTGDYRIRYVFFVRVNPLRTETYTVETEMFEVVE